MDSLDTTDETDADVEQVLRDARLKLGLSQRGLARRMGVSAPFLHDLEMGRRKLQEKYLPLLPRAIRRPVISRMIRRHREAIRRLHETRFQEWD